jgi:hypothetical protein
MSKSNGIKVVVGILGIATGVVGGILLARRANKESREEFITKIRDIFGIYNEEFRNKYNKTKDAIEEKILAVKKSGEMIDQEKYTIIVDEIIEKFKKDLVVTSENAEKLGNYLKKDWEKIKKTIA